MDDEFYYLTPREKEEAVRRQKEYDETRDKTGSSDVSSTNQYDKTHARDEVTSHWPYYGTSKGFETKSNSFYPETNNDARETTSSSPESSNSYWPSFSWSGTSSPPETNHESAKKSWRPKFLQSKPDDKLLKAETRVGQLEAELENLRRQNQTLEHRTTELEENLRTEITKSRGLLRDKDKLEIDFALLQQNLSRAEEENSYLKEKVATREKWFEDEKAKIEDHFQFQMRTQAQSLKDEREEVERMYEAKLAMLKEERERTQRKHEAELLSMKTRLKQDRDRAQEELKERVSMTKEQQKKMESKSTEQLESVRRHLEEERRELQAQFESRIQSVYEEKGSLRRDFEQQLQELRSKMKENEETIQRHHATALQAKEDELHRLTTYYERQISQLKDDTKNDLQRMQQLTADLERSLKEEMDRMQRRYDTELQTLLKDTKEEKQSMQHQQQLRLQSVQKEIDELHKHYTGRLRFLEDDTKEEKKRMRQRHETMLRSGEMVLERRDQEINDLLDLRQRREEFRDSSHRSFNDERSRDMTQGTLLALPAANCLQKE